MARIRSKLRRRPFILAVVMALTMVGVGAIFAVSQVAASGNESQGECTAQAVDDGTNDGETADDAPNCTAEQNGTDADAASEDGD